MTTFRIGDVARLTGANISTLRLWEQHGLVTPERTERGQRFYTAEQVQQVHGILRMRRVDGLNMSAIKRVAAPAPSSTPPSPAGSRASKRAEAAAPPVLGLRFRAARNKLGMSLKEAAEATGLTMSFISTFERTNRGATMVSLQKLAVAYETTVTELTGGAPRPHKEAAEVVRRGKEEIAPQFEPGIKIHQLATSLHALDCQRWVLAPGSRSEGAYSHEGEEFIHVLKGEFIITVDGGKTLRLAAGDSVSFQSNRPHMWMTGEQGETELLWINTPKSY